MLHRLPRAAALLALGAATLLGACASGGGGAAGGEPGARQARRGGARNQVTLAELQGATQANLYDALRAVRPQWFNPGPSPGGGTGGMGLPVVFIEGQLYGSLQSLRNITTSTVLEARYLTVSEAQGKYGARVDTPVVEVMIVRGAD